MILVLKTPLAREEFASKLFVLLARLKDKMLLLGHKDYPEACSEITKMIDEGTKARKRT